MNESYFGPADWNFWSVDPAEHDTFKIPHWAWAEAPGFWAPKESAKTRKVFRYYNRDRNHHFWTFWEPEGNGLPGYKADRVAYNVFPTQEAGTRPLVRFGYAGQIGNEFHHYWTCRPEAEALGGWNQGDPIGYVYCSEPTDPEIRGSVDYVHSYGRVPEIGNWLCRAEFNGEIIPAFGRNIDGMSYDSAKFVCEDYIRFARDFSKMPIPAHAHARVDKR